MPIRRARRGDVPSIQRVIHRSLAEVNTRDYSDHVIAFMMAHYSEDHIGAIVERGDQFVLEEEGRVLLTGALVENEIIGLFSEPTVMGHGHGRRMMAFLEQELLARGHREVVLHASVTARSFYEGLGYRSVREEQDPDFGPSTLMSKALEEKFDAI